MWYTPKMKLRRHDQSDRVLFMTKTKQDNNVTDHIGLVYTKNNTELLGPIGPGTVYDENNTRQ